MTDQQDNGQQDQRCGFVAVLGAPNAGKSTLMNEMVGSKVSIVSPKVQTTRTMVRGIAIHGDSQIIFVDTPGIFKPGKRLERAMVNAAWTGGSESDVILLLVDASENKPGKAAYILDRLREEECEIPVALVLNKIDKVAKQDLLSLAQKMNDVYPFARTFMTSALKADGLKEIANYLAETLPEGPWLYPEDQISDMPMRLLAAEITREKLFHRLHQELPYGLTVETEEWEEFDNGDVKISQVITVSKDSHKGMVVGKGGKQIKHIGETSRIELEEILEKRTHLKLFVRVKESWQDDPEQYQIWGLDYSS